MREQHAAPSKCQFTLLVSSEVSEPVRALGNPHPRPQPASVGLERVARNSTLGEGPETPFLRDRLCDLAQSRHPRGSLFSIKDMHTISSMFKPFGEDQMGHAKAPLTTCI